MKATDRTYPEVPTMTTDQVRAYLKDIYPLTAECEVVLKKLGEGKRVTNLRVFLEMLSGYETLAAFGSGASVDPYVVVDSELLNYTQVENDEVRMSIWKEKRLKPLYPEPLL